MKSLRSLSVVPGRRLRRKAGKHGASGGSVYDFDGAVCHAMQAERESSGVNSPRLSSDCPCVVYTSHLPHTLLFSRNSAY